MEEMLGWLLFGIIMLVIVGISFRSIKGSRQSAHESFAFLDQVLEDTKKRMAMDEENLSQQKRLIEQGDETIALLSAIRDNLEHRSLKN